MPSRPPGDPGDEHGEDGIDDPIEFRPPLPPDDRIWRHPSEVAAAGAPAAPPAPSPRRRQAVLVMVSAAIGATLSLGMAAAIGAFDRPTELVEREIAVQPVTAGTSEAETVAAIATRTAPAVAAVRVDGDGAVVAGSALVLRSDGYLVTTARLMADATAIEVRLHEGESVPAALVAVDDVTDVAVLHVDTHHLDPAPLGSAATLRAGDPAVALGVADQGGWSPSVTTGVVSAVEHRIDLGDGRMLHGMLLLDLPFAAGSTGGPMLDEHGAVVAITAGQPDGSDFVMATPIDVVRHVADQLIRNGRVHHVWLGIEGTDLPSDDAVAMGIAGGAVVGRVVPGSPAETAGLRADDVVVGVDDTAIDSMGDLISVLRQHLPGDEVVLEVRRGDEVVPIAVGLAEKA